MSMDPNVGVTYGSGCTSGHGICGMARLSTRSIAASLVFGSRARPVMEDVVVVPSSRSIDAPLIGGSALFGISRGLPGFCLGGAIPVLGLAEADAMEKAQREMDGPVPACCRSGARSAALCQAARAHHG